jgi:hypothetical protein
MTSDEKLEVLTFSAKVALVILAFVLGASLLTYAVVVAADRLSRWIAGVTLLLVLSVVPAGAQTFEKVYTVSEWGVFVGHIADGMTTQRVLGEGSGREANVFLLRHTDPLAMAGLKAAGAIGTVYLTRKVKRAGHPVLALVTNVAVTSALLTIAHRNDGIRKGTR